MLKESVLAVRKRIASACARAKQDADAVTLVAVSKGRTVAQIEEALEAGISDIGENRVNEASVKYNTRPLSVVDGRPIKWHMVGHLQTNKAKTAVEIFDLIHSVDSIRLAEELDKQASRINKVQYILVEVKTSPEATKFGLKPEETAGIISEIVRLKNIRIKGLMTIAPIVSNPEEARPYFRKLKEIFDEINRLSTIDYRLSTISMGMSDDFEVAIEEGANMVRIGRAIFGA